MGGLPTHYPVLLSIDAMGSDDLIKTVKEQLRRVPEKGLGYGVLKYINKEAVLQGTEPWDIIFNYLGQLDNVVRESKWLRGAGETAGAARSAEHVIDEKVVINGFIQESELVLNWSYSTLHYEQETIEQLARDYVLNLERLIIHCTTQQKTGEIVYTPSDYGLTTEVSYKELDQFLNEPFRGGKRKEWIESLYRLSGLQQGILFHSLYDVRAGGYTEQFGCDLMGIKADVVSRSWQYILKRHSILRSSFYYDVFNVPVQCVYRDVELPVALLDYRQKSEEDQKEAIKHTRKPTE